MPTTACAPTPCYFVPDALELLYQAEPMMYMRLSGKGVCRVLEEMNIIARDYGKFVGAYPDVCCEPLAPFYLYRKAAGMLDEHLLCDLLFWHGWREANWGVWLAALAPRPEYAPHLARALHTLPRAGTLLQLALGACGEALPQELEASSAILDKVRATLDRLPAKPAPLRRSPSPDQERAMRRERLTIRDAYRAGGLDAARPLLRQGLTGYYDMRHAEWLALGAPAAPAVPRLPRLRHKVVPRF